MLSLSDPIAPSGSSRSILPQENGEAHAFQAVESCRNGDLQGAIVAPGEALSLDPEREPAPIADGGWWTIKRPPQKAMGELTMSLVVRCCNAGVSYFRVQADHVRGTFGVALAEFSRVLRRVSDHRDALLHRALIPWYYRQMEQVIHAVIRLGAAEPRIVKALAKWMGMTSSR
jgi:hypothetical protein